MKYKKSMAITTVLIFFILGLLLLGVLYFVVLRPIPGLGAEVTAMGPSVDKLCVTRSKTFGEITDDDEDGRDDYLCDSCVCLDKSKCSNEVGAKGGADNDGDGLPAICDKDDKDKTNRAFNPVACPEKDLLELGSPWGKQCRPKIT